MIAKTAVIVVVTITINWIGIVVIWNISRTKLNWTVVFQSQVKHNTVGNGKSIIQDK